MRPMPELEVVKVPTADLIEYQNNAKEHPLLQVDQIAASIEQFGFNNPILAWHNDDGEPEIVAGHGRLMAARKLGLRELPVVFLDHMTEEQRRAYILVDNQLTMNSGFDTELLEIELDAITDIDMSEFGFDIELDDVSFGDGNDEVDEVDIPDDAPSLVHLGDVWQLGRHRLMCGDSTNQDNVDMLMNGVSAELLFTSPPYADMRTYNGDKELSTELLARFIPAYVPHCEYQAVNLGIKRQDHEIVQYWDDYIAAAHGAGLKLMAWNVWDKMMCGSVGQQMALVPCRHEFILVFGTRDKPLNKTWEKLPESVGNHHPKSRRNADGSMDTSKSRASAGDTTNPLKEMESVVSVMCETGTIRQKHPAVFPVGLPAEYIKAFTDEGDVVAEPFGGSGTTLIACERLNRECRCMELDPHYCDVIIERWQNLTGETARKVEQDG